MVPPRDDCGKLHHLLGHQQEDKTVCSVVLPSQNQGDDVVGGGEEREERGEVQHRAGGGTG